MNFGQKLVTVAFVALVGGAITECAQAQDLSQTPYKGVRVSWPANPAAENVGWYILEYNDEGLADDTWSQVNTTNGLSLTVTFEKLVELAARQSTPLELTDEQCFRLRAARVDEETNRTETSDPSEPACFQMLPDGGTVPTAPTAGTVPLTVPVNLAVELIEN